MKATLDIFGIFMYVVNIKMSMDIPSHKYVAVEVRHYTYLVGSEA